MGGGCRILSMTGGPTRGDGMREPADIGYTCGSEAAPKLVENGGVLFAEFSSHPRLLVSVKVSRESAESDVVATHDQVFNSLSPSKRGWDRCEDTCSNIAEPGALGRLALSSGMTGDKCCPVA